MKITDAQIIEAFEAENAATAKVDAKGRRYWSSGDDDSAILTRVAERLGLPRERVRSVMIDEWGSLGG